MADNGRISKIGGVLTAFGRIMSAHRGEVVCNVTTAKVRNFVVSNNLLLFLYSYIC